MYRHRLRSLSQSLFELLMQSDRSGTKNLLCVERQKTLSIESLIMLITVDSDPFATTAYTLKNHIKFFMYIRAITAIVLSRK